MRRTVRSIKRFLIFYSPLFKKMNSANSIIQQFFSFAKSKVSKEQNTAYPTACFDRGIDVCYWFFNSIIVVYRVAPQRRHV